MIPLYDLNATTRRPWVTWALIAANVLVFLWQYAAATALPGGMNELLARAALIPAEVSHFPFRDLPPRDLVPPPLTVLTSMFMHGGLLHIGGNMLYLWIFGDNVEDAIGPLLFAVFYLLAGVAAAALQVAFSAGSEVPMLGASGAIAGVLGAYLVCWPTARVRTLVIFGWFIRVVTIPASIVLGLWIALQVLYVVLGADDGTALFAHIGGFAFGALVALVLMRPRINRRLPPAPTTRFDPYQDWR